MVMGGSAPAVTRGQPSIRLLHLGFSLLTLIPERMGGSETNVRGLLGAFAAGEGPERVTVLANRHVKQGNAWNAPDGAAETHKATGPEPLNHELKLFLDACANRTEPAVDVEAGLLALRVVEAAQQSSKLGRRVPLSEMI